MVKIDSRKPETIILVLLLVVIIFAIGVISWDAESQVRIRGLALDEQGKIAQGLHIVAFEGNSQIGSSIAFESSSWEGRTPTSQVLTAEESNFELKLADRYSFPARAKYVGDIRTNEVKYISTPSGTTLQIVVLRDLSQITSIVPNATPISGPEPPATIKLLEYLIGLGPLGAIGIIIILMAAAIVTGVFQKIREKIVKVVTENLFIPLAQFGTVELVKIEKGQIIVSFPKKTKVEEETRLLVKGETIDGKSKEVARPVIGTATIYKLLENNRYWALINKVHEEAKRDSKFQIDKGCEIETYGSSDSISEIGLVHLNLGDKGRVYKKEGNAIFVNIGSDQGVEVGKVLEVVEPQIDLNGEYLGDLPVATLKVITCEAKFSECFIVNKQKEIILDVLVRIKKT